MKEKISYIISKIIYNRDFDIPEWIYEYIDEKCILEFLDFHIVASATSISNTSITFRYVHEEKVRKFFDNIREHSRFSKKFVKYIYDKGLLEFALLLFNKREYRIYSKIYNNDEALDKSLVRLVCKYAVIDDIFIDRARDIVKCSKSDKEEYIRVGQIIISGEANKYIQQKYLSRLLDILEVSDSPNLCKTCIECNIPAFYKYGDSVDAYLYLKTVYDTNWKAGLTLNFTNVIANTSLKELIFDIANKVDVSALRYFKYFIDSDDLRIKSCFEIYYKKVRDRAPITDFGILVDIFGKNVYGLPNELQTKFILDGGDIKTMLNYDEADILRNINEVSFIIDSIPLEDLKFFLYNSPFFIKNILIKNIAIKNLTHNNMIKIMKALFSGPFDKNLWDALNKIDSSVIDYRLSIVLQITAFISKEVIYQSVPEYMMYSEPSVFYITRNINKDNIRYIPIEKLIPYIKGIISREQYIPFNLYCDGEQVSLTKVYKDYDSLIQNIITYKKYGYICDIIDVDYNELINTVAKYV